MTTPEIEYSGAEAIEASARMTKIAVDQQNWTVTFRDKATGQTWILDYPNTESQGGGSPRLRQVHVG